MTDAELIAEARRLARWSDEPEDRDVFRQLAAALAAHQWQSIETAPKDRHILLLSSDGEQRVCRHMIALEDGAENWIYGRRLGHNPIAFALLDATHWMPLPAPPETKP